MLFKEAKPFAIVSVAAIALSCASMGATISLAADDDAQPAGDPTQPLTRENIRISVPTRIDYTLRPDGSLITPSSSALVIQNEGNREVRVEAIGATSSQGWNIVADAGESSLSNSASFTLGTHDEQIPLPAAGQEQTQVGTTVATQASWTLAAAGTSPSSATRAELQTDGEVRNVDSESISGPIGTTAWYVVDSTVTNDVYDKISGLENRVASLEGQLETANSKISALETSEARVANLYKVGSIYISTSADNPATLFGGTWEKIEGRFLLAETTGGAQGGNSSESIAAGYTGGEATHVLTPSETAMKNHSHSYDKTTSVSGGSHSHRYGFVYYTSWCTFHTGYNADPDPNMLNLQIDGSDSLNQNIRTYTSQWNHKFNGASTTSTGTRKPMVVEKTGDTSSTAHSHTIGTTSTSSGGQTEANGSAHNNMPPYLSVYMWKRTA